MMSFRELLTNLVFNEKYKLINPFFEDLNYVMAEPQKYLGTQIDELIPKPLCNFINKLYDQKEMEEKDFKSFQQELNSIKDDKVYNTIAYCVNTIARVIYHSHQVEIDESVKQIKDKAPIEIKETKTTNVGLLNAYLINNGDILDIKGYYGYSFPSINKSNQDIFEYAIPLGINALRLTNKLPKEGHYCGLDLSKHLYPKNYGGTSVEIPLHRGIKNKNEWAPFYKNSKLFKGDMDDSTYLATNGKKFLFIRGRRQLTSLDSHSVMASKIATFVSKKHFSSERRFNNQLVASKQLPEYKISYADNTIRDERRKIIQQDKRVYLGSGIINEVLNFVREGDPNSENYGFSAPISAPECSLSKIDFDHCDMMSALLKKDYERNIINMLYYRQPHVFLDPVFIQETLYTKLKLSLLTKELNQGFADKASADKVEQKKLADEATNRANIAFELFLENKNSTDFLQKNPNILNTILQESLDYAKKHFDEPMLSQINNSLRLRFKELHANIKKNLNITLPLIVIEKDQKKQPGNTAQIQQATDSVQKIESKLATLQVKNDKKYEPSKNWFSNLFSASTVPVEPSSITLFLDEKGSLVLKFDNEKENLAFAKDVKGVIPPAFRSGPQFVENKKGETPTRLNELCLTCPAYKSKTDLLSVNLGSQQTRDAFVKKLNLINVVKQTLKNGEIAVTYRNLNNLPVFTIYNNSTQNTAIYFDKSVFTKENEYITIRNGQMSLGTDKIIASVTKKF